MMTIIQSSATGEYLNAAGEWCAEPAKALTFETSLAALDYLFGKRLRNAVLVMRFKDPQHAIRPHPFEAGLSPDRSSASNGVEEAARKLVHSSESTAPSLDSDRSKTRAIDQL